MYQRVCRRDAEMATIQQRGDAQWRVQIRRRGPNGKLVAKARTFETHAAAKRWANVTEGRISGDEYTDRSKERRATLKEIVERYAREISPNKKGHASEVYRLRRGRLRSSPNGPFCLSSP